MIGGGGTKTRHPLLYLPFSYSNPNPKSIFQPPPLSLQLPVIVATSIFASVNHRALWPLLPLSTKKRTAGRSHVSWQIRRKKACGCRCCCSRLESCHFSFSISFLLVRHHRHRSIWLFCFPTVAYHYEWVAVLVFVFCMYVCVLLMHVVKNVWL